jgi:hypothetical protein
MSVPVETGCFTIGVFQDIEWARRGLGALRDHAFAPESMSIVAKETPEVAALLEQALGHAGLRMEVARLGPVVAQGPLIDALNGAARDLGQLGIAGTMRRVGFQAHDGEIFERLVARGGVLVAIHHEPRAADALAVLLNFGAGNSAIGAWGGRV